MEIILKEKYDDMILFHLKLLNSWKDMKLNTSQEISIGIIQSKILIYEGLLNNNKERYDKGLKEFIEYSSEGIELSNEKEIKVINKDNIIIYKNSEGKRQLGIILKKQYDKYILLGKKLFDR